MDNLDRKITMLRQQLDAELAKTSRQKPVSKKAGKLMDELAELINQRLLRDEVARGERVATDGEKLTPKVLMSRERVHRRYHKGKES